MLTVKAVTVNYGKVEAVKGISLEVGDGDIVALLGANGAGKTTIMKTISGLKSPSQGEIWFQDKRIDGLTPPAIVKIGISHVPEGRRIFRNMTVVENLILGTYLRSDRKAIKQDLDDIYEHFPILKERSGQRAGTLSGGEQQMLSIARALLCKPKLLLMDEPSTGLSPRMVDEIAEITASIQRRKISVILAEQNAALALKIATKGYVIEIGKVVLEGKRDELLSNENVRRAYLGV